MKRQGFGWMALVLVLWVGFSLGASHERELSEQRYSAAREQVCR